MDMKHQIAVEKEKSKRLQMAVAEREEAVKQLDELPPEVMPATETWIRGSFHNHHMPDCELSFSFECRPFNLTPGEDIEAPLEVVRHLEKNCRTPIYETVRSKPNNQAGVMGSIECVRTKPMYEFLIRETFEKPI